jgi:hypothetical protein
MISFNTNTKSFEDINKVLQDIKNQFNAILERLNPESFTQDSEAEGELGDLRIVRTEEDLNSFEIKTKDGWQRPYIGENIVVFKRKKDKTSLPAKKTIAEIETVDSSTGDNQAQKTIFDESTGGFSVQHLTKNQTGGFMNPDYDSGFFPVARGKVYVTGATTGVVPTPASFLYDDAAEIVGIPALGFTMTDIPKLIQVSTAPYGVTSFADAMTAEILCLDWQNQYYSSSNAMGLRSYATSPTHIAFTTANEHIYYATSSGGSAILTDNSNFHDAFNASGTADNCHIRVRIWK